MRYRAHAAKTRRLLIFNSFSRIIALGRSADAKSAIVVAFLAGLYFSEILLSGSSDADGYLRHVSAIEGFDRVTAWTVYGEIAQHFQTLQPGWFPVGPLPLALWLADPSEKIAKFVQFALVLVTFGTFGILARRLFGSARSAVFTAVISLAAWQLRMPHDPVIGTSFTMPVLAEYILLAFASWLAYRSTRKAVWLAVSWITVVLMMLADPLGWGFAGLLAVLAIIDRDKGRVRFVWLAIALTVSAVSMALGPPKAPWQRGGSYFVDVAAQLISPLPASYRAFGMLHVGGTPGFSHGSVYVDDRFINVPPVDAQSWLAIFACTLAAFIALVALTPQAETPHARMALYVGLGFWLIPAALLGPPGLWLSGVPLGQAFDAVFLQYFGIGILIADATFWFCKRAASFASLAPSLAALIVFLLCYGNVRSNAASILKTQRLASSTALIERAGSAGFFDVLPAGRTLAVESSEPFATGIHSRIADAKYVIYHYSKRRYRIVDVERMRSRPTIDAWALQTSRTSGIFVSLAHEAGYEGHKLKTDRAYGFSAIPSVQEELAIPVRGLVVKTWQLRDGFAIRARRTCGPVPTDLVYDGAQPMFTWGSGFYSRGPAGYSVEASRTQTEMFMGSRATLVLSPTTCTPRPLLFKASLQTAGAATLLTSFHRQMQRLSFTSIAPLVVRTPASRAPVRIQFVTNAPVADWDPIYFRYERDRPRELRLRFFSASISEDVAATVPPSLARKHK